MYNTASRDDFLTKSLSYDTVDLGRTSTVIVEDYYF